ncbi:MAG: lysylphosphatidylglycerol synthase transmembrane domain-containing protein [Candidatus Promineifilaceae bacterium]|jgi:glycosyltransferase 2 family protein
MLKNKKLRGVLQVLLSVILLALLFNMVGLREVAEVLSRLNLAWYIPAFVLFLLNIIIRAYRWYILYRSLNDRPSFGRMVYLYFVGFFANNFIPTGFGGDVVKVVSLRQQYGRGTEALSSVVMDRVTGLLGSSLIALAALVWHAIGHTEGVDLPNVLLLTIALISFGIPAGFLLLRWTNPFQFLKAHVPIIATAPFYDRFENLAETVKRYPFPVLLRSLLISLPFTLNLILIQYFIARALDVDVPPSVFPLYVPIIALINLLPFTFNGLGLREGAYLFLFVPIGVAPEAAVAMSLAFYFLRFGAGLVGGVMYAWSSVSHLLRSPQADNVWWRRS